MPFSSSSGKHLIDRLIQRISEAAVKEHRINVVDIGVGSGTYYDRYINTYLPKSKATWLGVEIWKPYIEEYQLESKYDSVVCVDANVWAEQNNNKSKGLVDICFVGDIIEHMAVPDAQAMVSNLLAFCRVVILSIPIGYYPQGEYKGNPYEAHIKDDWKHEEVLESFPNIIDYGLEKEIGVYFLSQIDERTTARALAPKIAVYAICKNEEQFATRFGNSVDIADYVVICDTGSTDKTKDLLTPIWNSRIYSTHVSPWRFDDARNAALMLVPTDADLCISLDLDETLQEGWYDILSKEIQTHYRLRGRLYDAYYCRFETIWDWETLQPGEQSKSMSSHWHERIHTRHNWKWRLPVHEILTYTGDQQEQIAWLSGLKMTQRPATKEGLHTYLPLIEQSLREDPNVWKSWFFYADELRKNCRLTEAVAALTKALDVPGCDQSYVYMTLGDYCADRDVEEAAVFYRKACVLSPNARETWVKLALLYKTSGQPVSARSAIQKAKTCTVPSTGYSYTTNAWNENFDRLYDSIVVQTNGE